MKTTEHHTQFVEDFTQAMESRTPGKTAPKAFNDRLRTLAAWLLKRADEPHNERTTRSMLRQKVEEALSSPGGEI